ncbi:MAG: hypothetical protein IT350_07845 [Deltaproteobacteria bacterium]|nr:hypothetical protein [Deltaproteobacteria bacterium]
MKRTEFRVFLVVFALSIASLALAFSLQSEEDVAPSAAVVPPEVVSLDEDEVEEYLGGGAIAYWQTSETRPVNGDGFSETSTLVIHGADVGDIRATVRLSARIGPLNRNIFDDVIDIPARADVTIPVNLGAGLELHPKQLEYTTKILGNVRALHADTEVRHTQLLPVRFVAFDRNTAAWQVMDADTRDARYPYGFTTPEGQELVRQVLARTPAGELVDDIGPDISPPVEEEPIIADLSNLDGVDQ